MNPVYRAASSSPSTLSTPTDEGAWPSSIEPYRSLAPSSSQSKVGHFLHDLSQRMQKSSLGRKTSTSHSEPNPPHRTLSGRSRIPLVSASETGRDAPYNHAWPYPPPAPSQAAALALRTPVLEPLSHLKPAPKPQPSRPRLMHAKSSGHLGHDSVGRGVPRAQPQPQAGSLAQRRHQPELTYAMPSPSSSPASEARSRSGSDASLALIERLDLSSPPPPMPVVDRHQPARAIALPTSITDVLTRYDQLFADKLDVCVKLKACDTELTKLGTKVLRITRDQQQLERRRAQWARGQAPRAMPDVPEAVGDTRSGSPPLPSDTTDATQPSAHSAPARRPHHMGGGFGPLVMRSAGGRVAARSAPATPAKLSPEISLSRDYTWELGTQPSEGGISQPSWSANSSTADLAVAAGPPSQGERNIDGLLYNLKQQIQHLLDTQSQLRGELHAMELERKVLFEWARSSERRG